MFLNSYFLFDFFFTIYILFSQENHLTLQPSLLCQVLEGQDPKPHHPELTQPHANAALLRLPSHPSLEDRRRRCPPSKQEVAAVGQRPSRPTRLPLTQPPPCPAVPRPSLPATRLRLPKVTCGCEQGRRRAHFVPGVEKTWLRSGGGILPLLGGSPKGKEDQSNPWIRF